MKGEKMYDENARRNFQKLKGSDADYLLICKENVFSNRPWAMNQIPKEDSWETISEAIAWHCQHGWKIVEIYDLYAEFEVSMVRYIYKDGGYYINKIPQTLAGDQIILAGGDVVDLRPLRYS
jgi:hypothetical protein